MTYNVFGGMLSLVLSTTKHRAKFNTNVFLLALHFDDVSTLQHFGCLKSEDSKLVKEFGF